MRKDHTEAAVALSKSAMHSEEFLCPHSLQVYLLLYPKHRLSAMLVFASLPTTPHFPGTASLAVQARFPRRHFRDHLGSPPLTAHTAVCVWHRR